MIIIIVVFNILLIWSLIGNATATVRQREDQQKEHREEIKRIEDEFNNRLDEIDQDVKKIKASKAANKLANKPNPPRIAVKYPITSSYAKTKNIPALVKSVYGSDFSIKVASCESASFKPEVVYGPQVGLAGERGVMQIHPTHLYSGALARAGFTWNDMFIPEKNLAFGKILLASVGGNWSPTWTCASLV